MLHSVFFYPYSFNLFDKTDAQIVEKLKSVPEHKKILLWSMEAIDAATLMVHQRILESLGLLDRTYWLLQPCYADTYDLGDITKELSDNCFLIDLDILLLNLHVNVCKTSRVNRQWNYKAGKFLFPTGKPDKPNRIRLLHKFVEAGVIDRCDWSLFVDDINRADARMFLPELTDLEFDSFVAKYNRNLDDIKVSHITSGSNHSQGYPFDSDLYANSSFRVVSETQMLNQLVVTEKTWISILNHLPFIMAGYQGNLSYLKRAGYKTFEEYLPIPDYDQILDQEQRLDAVVENTKFWLENIEKQHHLIGPDVEHNRLQLDQAIANNLALAANLLDKMGEGKRSIYSLVPLSPEHYRWAAFYYNIKAESWPDCFLEESFFGLPIEIQRECIEQFGYQPKIKP